MSIAEALGIDGKRKALHAILDGDTSIVNFNILNDDWNIEEKPQQLSMDGGSEQCLLTSPCIH